MSLKQVARDTLAVLERGSYRSPAGTDRSIAAAQQAAVAGTCLFTPEQLSDLLSQPGPGGPAPIIEVTPERTQVAAQRLAQTDGLRDVVLLNFASARNPGGGFINGAKAQEEDLARCSGLYACLQEAPGYYASNRSLDSMLYTDHLIYSPGVPFFRVRSRRWLEQPFCASIITGPAPNAGQALRRDPAAGPRIDACLRRRAGMVLAVARQRGHRNLVLGAWGCGVFLNDPARVAAAFGHWLASERFAGSFDRVVFGIMARDRRGRANLQAFETHFKTAPAPAG